MNRVKTLPPGFLLITLLLACVAAAPSVGAAVIQGDPGQNVSSTPLRGPDMPAFCSMEQGGSAVHCEPDMQNVSPGTPALGDFTPGSSDTSGGITQEFMNDCPSVMDSQNGYAGFNADPLVASGGALSHGFAPERKIAYTELQAGSTLAGREATIDQSLEPSGQQNLQFAGVSGTALTFSEPSNAKSATSGFAYPGYHGSGARASVGSVSFPHWCRF
ncbi:MAG: hypothetical protein LUQ45_02665 [Methanoregulaceae archaeon]|nr:hypothetical protein [Methanoregulaceae archaeon]